MLQVYLVRHGETQWNAERRIQGQSDSPLTAHGERQAWQVGERARTLGITHIITSDLGRTRRTAEIIAEACGCSVIADARLRELDMGVLEKRHIDSLSEEEEGWRRRWSTAHRTVVFRRANRCRSSASVCMRRWHPVWNYPPVAGRCW